MKKILLCSIFTVALSMVFVSASMAQNWNEPRRRWLFELGAGGSALSAIEGQSASAFGIVLGIGYYVSPRSYVELDFGIFSRTGEQVGTFSYVKTTTNSLGQTSSTTHNDGVIKRRRSINPVMLSWVYEFRLAERFLFKLGPTVGSNSMSDGFRFIPGDVEGLPEMPEEEIDMLSAGVTTVISWLAMDFFSVDFTYRPLYNSPGTFNGEPFSAIGHNFKLTLVMRLGR